MAKGAEEQGQEGKGKGKERGFKMSNPFRRKPAIVGGSEGFYDRELAAEEAAQEETDFKIPGHLANHKPVGGNPLARKAKGATTPATPKGTLPKALISGVPKHDGPKVEKAGNAAKLELAKMFAASNLKEDPENEEIEAHARETKEEEFINKTAHAVDYEDQNYDLEVSYQEEGSEQPRENFDGLIARNNPLTQEAQELAAEAA